MLLHKKTFSGPIYSKLLDVTSQKCPLESRRRADVHGGAHKPQCQETPRVAAVFVQPSSLQSPAPTNQKSSRPEYLALNQLVTPNSSASRPKLDDCLPLRLYHRGASAPAHIWAPSLSARTNDSGTRSLRANTMAPPPFPCASIELDYPLYALDFDQEDSNHLVVGGGGGAGRSGVGNKIVRRLSRSPHSRACALTCLRRRSSRRFPNMSSA